MRLTRAIACTIMLSAALAGCGGGGGDGSTPPVTFSPSTATANVAAGSSQTLTVRATAADPSQFSSRVYVYIVDTQHVITPSVELTQVSNSTLSATLHTVPTLTAGRYQGAFQVQLCNDAACKSQLPGSPVALPFDFTITAAPLQATAITTTSVSVHQGGSIATPVSVSVTGAGLSWSASTTASWLQIAGGSGTGDGTISVTCATATLAQGSYASAIIVKATDGQTVSVPFSVDVLPTGFVTGGSGLPSFSAVNGAPIPSQTLSIALDNGTASAWQASVSQPWLLATPLSGTTPAVMTLQPDPTRGSLASGTYNADIVLTSGSLVSRTISTQLTLTAPMLSAPTTTITLGGAKGRDMTTSQGATVSLNTGTNSWPYTLSGLPSWATSSPSSGTVNQAGTLVSFQPQAGSVAPGSRSAAVTMMAAVNGDRVTLPITLNINADQRRLLPSEWGVGLASTPTGTITARTLTIRDNFGAALAWTASSDVTWLSVTATGTTGATSTLSLIADPSSLPSDTVSYANVTVSTATSGVSPAVIRVGFWKSASGLAAITKLPVKYSSLIADKIRPYVYANNGGTSIDVYNAYTAQRIQTIPSVGAALGRMTVSLDGSQLYALDTANKSMAVVDLTTLAKSATWALDKAVTSSTSLVSARPNGVETVLLGDYTAYAAGRSLGNTGVAGVVATSDGQKVFSTGSSWSVDYSEMSGGVLFAGPVKPIDSHSGGNTQDVAISKDGSRAYVASGGGTSGGYKCAVVDGVTGAFVGSLPGGEAYPNNVEVTTDGRPICGIMGWYSTYDFWVHSPTGALIQGYKIAGYAKALLAGQMVVSPDGLVVVSLTDDPYIGFVPIGP